MRNILNKEEIDSIIKCGKILRESLAEVLKNVKPKVSSFDLDKIAYKEITKRGAVPSFLGYEVIGAGKFPSTLCISINDEVVHGIPSKRVLESGDLISIDIGAQHEGICTDMAVTVPVGEVTNEALKLIEVTKKSLDLGIKQAQVGNSIGDIGHAVQSYAEANGMGVVRDLVGHGIGQKAHLEPRIPNYGDKGSGPRIELNMALAIEPMLTAGDYRVTVKDDGWTVVTRDGSLAAHFEHTVVVTKDGPLVVTA